MGFCLRELDSQIITNMDSDFLILWRCCVAMKYFVGISELAFDSFNTSYNCFFVAYLLLDRTGTTDFCFILIIKT